MRTHSPVDLNLMQSPLKGGWGVGNVTRNLQGSWRRSIQSLGGFWMATARFEGAGWEKEKAFLNWLGYGVQEAANGETTWEGYLAEMTLRRRGVAYRRSLLEMANRVKVEFSDIGTNMLSNPSCETVVWDAMYTPSVRERSTAWKTQGNYSCHLVTTVRDHGAIVQNPIPIVAGKAYVARMSAKVVSGVWWMELYRPDIIGYGNCMWYHEVTEPGEYLLWGEISEDNGYTGNIGMRFVSALAGGEAYGDAAVFQEAPHRGETGWFDQAMSQAEFGVYERVLSKDGMTEAAAEALAQTELSRAGWPVILTPDTMELLEGGEAGDEDVLEMVFVGYGHTLKNVYSTLTDQADANVLLTALVGLQPNILGVGKIDANTMEYNPANGLGMRAWDVAREVTQAGDASGKRWEFGVYAGRLAYYNQASESVQMYVRNGELLGGDGGRLEGWRARPGLAQVDDFALFSAPPSGSVLDGANKFYMGVVEFDLGAWLRGGSGLTLRREAAG